MFTAIRDVWLGRRLPDANLAEMVDGNIVASNVQEALGRGVVLIAGIPGAFTPVCSQSHVPDLVASADRLKKSGIGTIACIVASDPYVMDAWARSVDPGRKLRFLSDGNLDLARAFGLISRQTSLFLGDRSERYVMKVRNGVIEAIRVERAILDYTCTHADDFVLDGV